MKKIVIFIICVIIILTVFAYIYYNYKWKKNDIDANNMIYKMAYEKELNGNNLATIINKALDTNEKNKVEKDDKGLYIENNENSIKNRISQ